MSAATAYDPRILANRLIDAGVPVVVCRPNPNRGRPMPTDPERTDQRELLVPPGWSTVTAADCDVSGFRVGVDVLAMVGGHGVDAVDVDTKDGGNVKNLPPFRSFGLTRTPSGGWHHYVRSTGIGKISPLRTSAGHVGDYVGGTPDGGGRLLAYLPGSTRPKYPGKTYELVEDLDLDALLEHDADDDLVGALLGHGGTREGLPGRPAVKHSEVQAFYAEHSVVIPEDPCRYGRAAIDGLVRDAGAVVPGDPTRGRHGWAVRSATRAVELVRAGCATAADLDRLEATLDRVKPEGGTDWGGVLGWALANATGTVGCGMHSPAPGDTPPPSPISLDAAHAVFQRWLGDDYDLDELEPVELPGGSGAEPISDGARELILTPASAIKPRRVKWAWAGRIALGTLALLAGPEGLGKSTLAYWVAARVTRGELPGEDQGRARGVLVCATEDSWEHTIVPRLIAADADLDRVFRVEVRMAHDIHVGLSLPRDLVAVEAAARRVDAALLILDPLMSRLDANLDTHRDGEVRRALEPLAALADRAGMAVLGLIHHNKSGSADPLQVVMASKAFTAVARSVHSVIRDPDDDSEARRLFGTPKNNLGRTDQPTLAFTIASHAIDTDDGTAWTGRIEWAGEVAGTIRDAMSRSNDGGDRTATAEAGDWLADYLTSRGGEASSADVKKAGAAAGHSQDCLKRAKRRLGVLDRSEGFPRRTLWELPPRTVGATVGAQSAQDSRGDAPTALTECVSAPTVQVRAQSVQSVQSERPGSTGAPTVLPPSEAPAAEALVAARCVICGGDGGKAGLGVTGYCVPCEIKEASA